MTPADRLADLAARRLAHEAAGSALRAEIAAAVADAMASGVSAVEIAGILGVTRARVYQLLDAHRRTSSAQQ